nr:glycoside hydrolase family 36 protein [Jiangella mangrovi]
MGAIEDGGRGATWLWQIEHNGPSHWAVGDHDGDLFLLCSGPASAEHQWRRRLAPGDTFESVPVTVVVSDHGLEHAFGLLTGHRRVVRRPHADNEWLPVVFNDYMNCLKGDPTEADLVPLIDAAAAAGAEYFVIDAGWHAVPKPWWDEVGAWEESRERFPHGLAATMDRIRAAGMVPGLWVEPEVVGVRSPAARTLPDEAFFQRDGRRIVEVSRYHLDLRHPAARSHLDAVVDRLVSDYGVGYLKFDYNIDIGPGTDFASDSLGNGLLGHDRALLAWLDGVLDRHPGLVIENCASGGMRADGAMLSRLSIHSTSDQTDHRRYPAIAAAAPTVAPPEQAAVWAYPQPHFTAEENALTMVNALLGRVHLSGRIDLLDGVQAAAVSGAVDVYKSIRSRLAEMLPRWPLGLPRWSDPWVALAQVDDAGTLLSVWRRDLGRGPGPDRVEVPLPWLAGTGARVEVLFPVDLPTSLTWDDAAGVLSVGLPGPWAGRLLEVRPGI